ncbi:Rrf2 family transcriptional regulator [uncultured Piscinibacter sp.]|mgnify:CR=1 FL=1|uniref:Rrf2 family transcriptional regulator n=1 Tax=uncultured Piscinibacter sp. TaxID=1131835 RepID=UPI002609F4D9|nr:Rrf2 family transcriptional regulator [uncultured Piscinibacter sp.]
MRLTSFTDYSLRVLIYLACEPGRRATIAEVAGAFEVSENHLTKVVHFLGQQGWVATVRGKGGGMALARGAGEIVVGDVVRRTEGDAMPAECFDATTNHCTITRACRLQGALREATDAFHAALDRYTLADLVHNRATLSRMLFIGRERADTNDRRTTP